MKEEKTYREPDVQPDDDVIVIEWMGLVRRAWNCRRLLSQKYAVVCTNPPYLNKYNNDLKKFVNFPE